MTGVSLTTRKKGWSSKPCFRGNSEAKNCQNAPILNGGYTALMYDSPSSQPGTVSVSKTAAVVASSQTRVSFNGRTLASQANNVGSIPITRSTSTFQGLPPNARERRKSLSGLRIFTQYRSTDIQRNPLTAGSNWYVEWYIGNAEVPKTVLLLEEPGFRREHGIQLVSQELGSCFQTSRFDRPR